MRGSLPLHAWRAARRRDAGIVLAYALPCGIAICICMGRWYGLRAALLAGGLWLLGCIVLLILRWHQHDAQWLVRRLNAQRRDMEDSADLLLQTTPSTPLQALQQQRLVQRLHTQPADVRAPWPYPQLLISLLPALLLAAVAIAWPSAPAVQPSFAVGRPSSLPAVPLHLRDAALHITPPAYTGLPQRHATTLSIKAPVGTRLQWRLRFSRMPSQVILVFLDGRKIPLRHAGDTWTADLVLTTSALYRVQADVTLLDTRTLYRLDAIADLPPQVTVVQPAHSLSVVPLGQGPWALAFTASDDYGVQAQAKLHLTLAQGSGENIAIREHSLSLIGQGPPRLRRFQQRVDLAALGVQEGDDLIAQLEVTDNRLPQPQIARSPSVILRISRKQDTESTGMEGVVRRVLPAYFRSQRQIILDAEALQKQRRLLASTVFVQRADAIGVDQRILRLRYGQFLGEEAEGGPKTAPTADAAQDTSAHTGADADDHQDAAHAAPTDTPTFGQIDHLLENFGHTHDIAEAATLLDPDTRAILKQALDQMWQSELQLRQGQPDRALPFAYKALGLIKRVQQADRIFLAKVGPQLPPVDESRRMHGKRDGIASRADALPALAKANNESITLWQTLAAPASATLTLQRLQTFEDWLRTHPQASADPLALQAAISLLRQTPTCAPCREDLRKQLWPLLAVPPAQPMRRTAPNAQGQRYLDALSNKAKP